jgi:hypothetical protein
MGFYFDQQHDMKIFLVMSSKNGGSIHTVSSFSAKMAEIRSKTVGYAQFKFDHHFWLNLRQIWSKFFQTGRISSELAHKKISHGLNFDQIERNSTENGGRI